MGWAAGFGQWRVTGPAPLPLALLLALALALALALWLAPARLTLLELAA